MQTLLMRGAAEKVCACANLFSGTDSGDGTEIALWRDLLHLLNWQSLIIPVITDPSALQNSNLFDNNKRI
jgi:hypothetical protein